MARSSGNSSLSNLPPYGALVLRLALGACMVYHGYGKVVPGHAMDHYAHYIVSLGLPYWLGYVSALTEFAGGILVFFGLLTRPAAALIAINMLVAIVKVNAHQGLDACQLSGLLLAMAVALVCFGGGAYALDRKIGFA
ncbi:MAG TPA: DoxX family protein [Acidobacteriaceae bacterium]|jgi:putative oxidoreductase|nr:DoxX family protein [Acidobacteriaceae bacterium]